MTNMPAGPMPEHPLPPAHPSGEPGVHTLLLDIVQQMGRIEGTQNVMAQQLQDGTDSRRRLHEKLDTVSEKAGAAAHRAEIAVSHAEQAAKAAAQAVAASAALKPSVDDYVTMRGYVRAGLAAFALIIVPALGLIGWGAMWVWNYIIAHIDFSMLWKR